MKEVAGVTEKRTLTTTVIRTLLKPALKVRVNRHYAHGAPARPTAPRQLEWASKQTTFWIDASLIHRNEKTSTEPDDFPSAVLKIGTVNPRCSSFEEATLRTGWCDAVLWIPAVIVFCSWAVKFAQ